VSDRSAVLVREQYRKIISSRSAGEYLQGGARYAGKEKVHFNDGGYFVLDSRSRCQKCADGKCRTVRLSRIQASNVTLRETLRTAAPCALTAKDVLGNVEGLSASANGIRNYGLFEDYRPAASVFMD
jgi:hypothetical protein